MGLEKDDKDDMITKYALKIGEFQERNVDEKILTVLKDEMQKLSSLERNSPEFNVTRSYLDWLVSIPWKVLTEDRYVEEIITMFMIFNFLTKLNISNITCQSSVLNYFLIICEITIIVFKIIVILD